MSNSGRAAALLLGLVALALAAGAVYALFLIGSETLRTLALVGVIGGLVIALVWAAQFPLRAWRSNIQPERHVYHERVREIHHVPVPDPNLPPALPRLPAQTLVAGPVYPELLRAAFLAGRLQAPQSSGAVVDGAAQPWREAASPADGDG